MKIRIENISSRSKSIIKNVMGVFFIKGGSLIINVLLLPSYIRFFDDQVVLGIWFTILSVLNWVTLFDLGLGNGLRNKLPGAFENNNRVLVKRYISTTYITMVCFTSLVTIVGILIIPYVNWNSIFNISASYVDRSVLITCVRIVFVGIMMHLVLKIITSILYSQQKSVMVNMLALVTNILMLLFLSLIPPRDLATNLEIMALVNVFVANIPYVICTVFVFSFQLKDVKPSLKYFSLDSVKEILNIGVTLLWLQLVFMMISSTNELVISRLTKPDYVVEYQVYYKIFKTGAMIISLALIPVWSAVTKAQAQKDYLWIKKIYTIFIVGTIICFGVELAIIPIMQKVINIWIGEGTVVANPSFALVFVFSSVMMILHNVNTSIGNGLSYFKIQTIWMTVAAILFIPLSYVFVEITGSWIGVVIANIVVLVPYEFISPVYTLKLLNKKIAQECNTRSY